MKKALLIILGSCLSFSSKAQSEFLPNLFEKSSWQLSIGENNGAQRAAIGYVTPKIWQYKFQDQNTIRMNLETEFAYWNKNDSHTAQLSLSPIFTFKNYSPWFIQGGVGGSLFSRNNFFNPSTSRYNIVESVGAGYQLNTQTTLSYRVSHYSNARINNQQIILRYEY